MHPRSLVRPSGALGFRAQSGSGVAEASQKAKVKGGPNKQLSEPFQSSISNDIEQSCFHSA